MTRTQPMTILDVPVDNLRTGEAMEIITTFLRQEKARQARAVFFANVHSIQLAKKKHKFLDSLNRADLVLPDGSGLKLAGRLFGRPIRENLNGTDFTPKLLRKAEQEGWSVYLFGSGPDVVRQCCAVLKREYPRLEIAGCAAGFLTADQEQKMIEEIRKKRPHLLLVGLGSPRQEEWIMQYGPQLPVCVCMGVGGLFDFIAGKFRRAPLWMRRLGIEWIFRFLQDPKRKWDRVFVEIPEFLITVLVKALLPRNFLRIGKQ